MGGHRPLGGQLVRAISERPGLPCSLAFPACGAPFSPGNRIYCSLSWKSICNLSQFCFAFNSWQGAWMSFTAQPLGGRGEGQPSPSPLAPPLTSADILEAGGPDLRKVSCGLRVPWVFTRRLGSGGALPIGAFSVKGPGSWFSCVGRRERKVDPGKPAGHGSPRVLGWLLVKSREGLHVGAGLRGFQ